MKGIYFTFTYEIWFYCSSSLWYLIFSWYSHIIWIAFSQLFTVNILRKFFFYYLFFIKKRLRLSFRLSFTLTFERKKRKLCFSGLDIKLITDTKKSRRIFDPKYKMYLIVVLSFFENKFKNVWLWKTWNEEEKNLESG